MSKLLDLKELDDIFHAIELLQDQDLLAVGRSKVACSARFHLVFVLMCFSLHATCQGRFKVRLPLITAGCLSAFDREDVARR